MIVTVLALALAPTPSVTPAPSGDRPPLGVLGRAGITTAGFGVVFTGAGLALTLREPTPLQGDPSRRFDTRPVGYGFLAVAGAALVTGTSLLVMDRVRARRRVGVTLFGAGLGVVGRF